MCTSSNDCFVNGVMLCFSLGVLTSNARLDYEQKTSYSLAMIIEPQDINCTLTVRIDLINIRDNPVTVDHRSLIYNITEHHHIPMYLGRIQFIDMDQLYVYQYEFYLQNQTSMISIEPMTGSIVVHDQFDRERHGSTLIYQILVRDYWHEQTNYTIDLFIHIDDINDHGPRFAHEMSTVNISKSLRSGSVLVQVNATSDDPQANGDLTYALMTPSDYVSIDEHTGTIRLKTSLISVTTNFSLDVQVKEQGINLTDQTTLLISIINDDEQVYFNSDENRSCAFNENQSIGTSICTIGKNTNDFIYELVQTTNAFDLKANNATIVTTKVFDYELDDHIYNLTILVKDRENQVNMIVISDRLCFV
jgi:protocadherin Fat 1/2/3